MEALIQSKSLPKELNQIVFDYVTTSKAAVRWRHALVMIELRDMRVQAAVRNIIRKIHFRRIMQQFLDLLPAAHLEGA